MIQRLQNLSSYKMRFQNSEKLILDLPEGISLEHLAKLLQELLKDGVLSLHENKGKKVALEFSAQHKEDVKDALMELENLNQPSLPM